MASFQIVEVTSTHRHLALYFLSHNKNKYPITNNTQGYLFLLWEKLITSDACASTHREKCAISSDN